MTASPALATCAHEASSAGYTATVRTSRTAAVARMRTAISPRLATSSRWITGAFLPSSSRAMTQPARGKMLVACGGDAVDRLPDARIGPVTGMPSWRGRILPVDVPALRRVGQGLIDLLAADAGEVAGYRAPDGIGRVEEVAPVAQPRRATRCQGRQQLRCDVGGEAPAVEPADR